MSLGKWLITVVLVLLAYGLFCMTIPDPLHSTAEARFVIIGTSGQRLVVVAHTDRKDRVRIIGARPATRAEKKKHEEGKKAGS